MTHDDMKRTAWVMALEDGETCTGLDGCWFGMTTPEQVERLDDGDPHVLPDTQGIASFNFKDD